jgi:hypothetical protein
MAKARKFKSKAAYKRWAAWGHMHSKSGKRVKNPKKSVMATTPGHQKIKIKGKAYKPKHSKK